MKTAIHPAYDHATVTCTSCGTSFSTQSTRSDLRVDTCSNCHSFYTGTRRLADADGRIDRFNQRLARAAG